ncbi:MAG: response regulator [Gammaproteobacteria bacterium]|nr:response regulator [Gammaproteobacteria bacterium]
MNRPQINIVAAMLNKGEQMRLKKALRIARLSLDCQFLPDQEELIKHIRGCGRFANREQFPAADLIILNLELDSIDAFTFLEQFKAECKRICPAPLIVISAKHTDYQRRRALALGVNSVIKKPDSFEALMEIVNAIDNYWLKTVKLPAKKSQG